MPRAVPREEWEEMDFKLFRELRYSPEEFAARACTLGGVVLELYPFAGKSTSGLRLGLVVSDLEATLASLRSKQIAVTAAGGGSATVTDPDGHQLVLEQERR